MLIPKPGDIIYVRTSMYIDHGEDDFRGGKATVTEVTEGISAGVNVPFVSIKERPGYSYNWVMLSSEQEDLKERFGDRWSHPDPDYGTYESSVRRSAAAESFEDSW